jgi:cell filamentation protein
VFDPFKDFESAGYLRNKFQEKDLEVIRQTEHSLFLANMQVAIDFLAKLDSVTYSDFLQVHEILFSSLYPWAGKSRFETAPEIAISKAGIEFCHPNDVQRAVEHGLRLGQSGEMRRRPGRVMGLFAYGHPFLDGNGRTMLMVHADLCRRAGFSIDWTRTDKTAYLKALGDEIKSPNAGHLDDYLRAYVGPKIGSTAWSETLKAIKGLDGHNSQSNPDQSDAYDEAMTARYEDFERNRGYQIPPSK